ncbi:MAG TPA: tetratricopeptide repeat protein [Candidatus Udaeobacter sp.]|nr:tetratricopeptide repeat protein [Candidatus Udaeobacter sp.]
MKTSSAFILITALSLCVSQVCQGQAGKNVKEANKLARDGAEAAKSQEWDKAVELLRKATALDHKYADELATVYQQRGYAFASNQQYQDAIQDFTEALKLKSNDARIYEQRAAVEMKMYDYDKALGDYSEIIKLKPSEVRYYNYRAYIYELKDDLQISMADTEKVLKMDPNNQDAKARKQRLEQKLAERTPLTPPPTSSPHKSPSGKKKP